MNLRIKPQPTGFKGYCLLLKITHANSFNVLLSLTLPANCQGLNSPSARNGKQMCFGCLSCIQSCVLRYVPACGGTCLWCDAPVGWPHSLVFSLCFFWSYYRHTSKKTSVLLGRRAVRHCLRGTSGLQNQSSSSLSYGISFWYDSGLWMFLLPELIYLCLFSLQMVSANVLHLKNCPMKWVLSDKEGQSFHAMFCFCCWHYHEAQTKWYLLCWWV